MSKVMPRTARPFVKWVGGKAHLLKELTSHIERAGPINIYHEPFLGGGALFFELRRHHFYNNVVLSEACLPLVMTFNYIRLNVESLITDLRRHKRNHCEEYFYSTREKFNKHILGPHPSKHRKAIASAFIYLNKAGFNGLWRVNKREGAFNVPIGNTRPNICDAANLRLCSRALKGIRVKYQEGFIDTTSPGDLVYFDPPFEPAPGLKNFTMYTQEGFNQDDQRILAKQFSVLSDKGIKCILSNSDTPFIHELYKMYHMHIVQRPGTISCKGSNRGRVDELIITNF